MLSSFSEAPSVAMPLDAGRDCAVQRAASGRAAWLRRVGIGSYGVFGLIWLLLGASWQRGGIGAVPALIAAALALALVATVFALIAALSRQQERLAAAVAAEAAASRFSASLRDAIDSLSVSFSLFDADDRLVIANRAASAMPGVTPGVSYETLLEHAMRRLVDPALLGSDPDAWKRWRLERHHAPDGPLDLRYRSGKWVRVEETRTGGGGTVVTRTDITELKQMAEALRLSEERFRDYVATASEWYWDTDEAHRMSHLSGRTDDAGTSPEVLGVQDAQCLIGKRRIDFAVDGESEAEKWRAHYAALDRHEPFFNFVFKTRSNAGIERFASVSGKPVFDGAGRFRGYRGTGHDVTEQILAEGRLYDAKTAAEAANRAKSEFLAGMSHELRTPLNAIIGFSQLIVGGAFADDVDRVRGYNADILASATHLLRIINDILEVSRIEAGRLELREDAVDVAAAVDACVRLVRLRAEEGGVRLVRELPPDVPRLRADDTRLRQILLNLLSNAIKFTLRDGTVTVAVAQTEIGLRLTVQDTGIGMSEDEMVIAMQPFRQVDSSLARRFEGTGLGLPLAKSLVELHGGTLRMTSAPGIGTSVDVTFPAARVLDGAAAHPAH